MRPFKVTLKARIRPNEEKFLEQYMNPKGQKLKTVKRKQDEDTEESDPEKKEEKPNPKRNLDSREHESDESFNSRIESESELDVDDVRISVGDLP